MIVENLILKEVTIFPELFLGISLIYLIIHCSFLSIQKSYPLIQSSILNLSVLILIFVCYLVIRDPFTVQEFVSFNNTFVTDYLGYISKFITGLLVLFWVLACQSYIIKQKFNNFEFILLILFSVLGMFLLCSSNDLITAYLSIELQSLSFYVLASYKKSSTFSIESGIKYFILGAFASSIFLFGSSLLYGVTGTVNFEDFKDLFTYSEIQSNLNNNSLSDNLVQYNLILESIQPFLADKLINDSSIINKFPNVFEASLSKTFTEFDIITQYNYVYENIAYLLGYLVLNFDLSNLLDIHYCEKKELLNEEFLLILLSELEILNSYIFNGYNINTLIFWDLELVKFSLLLIIASLFFKLTVAPFHLWAVDVYENSPSPSTFFFSVVPKISLFILFVRIFYYSFPNFIEPFRHVFVVFIILSVLVGSFGGISQKKFKSLLVYSSISHMGYCVMALSTGIGESVQMLFCYLIVYSLSGLCLWSILMVLNIKTSYINKRNKDLTDFSLLYKSNSFLTLVFSASLLSLAGLPPMIGFLVKISLFLTAIESSLYFVAFISMIASVIAVFYYLKLVKLLYFENNLVGKLYYPVSTKVSVLIAILFFMFIYLFINPTFLYLISLKFN